MNLLNDKDVDLPATLEHFAKHGFARLGPVMHPEMLERLRDQSNAVMLGQLEDPGLFYQHDSPSGKYEDLHYGQGWQGPSLAYRKIEKMEREPVFRDWIGNDLFDRIAQSTIGKGATIYRAVLWNKAARGGTKLPWHQDDGPFWGIDVPPSLQIWTALDDASEASGCLEILPGSHLDGLASSDGGTVPKDRVDACCLPGATQHLPAQAGESILLHNHLWHRSNTNETDQPRRAFSIAYLSADTRCRRRRRAPRRFTKAFEETR